MSGYINNQFVQVPKEVDWTILRRGDKLIYANIRRHDGKDGCFPAIATVAKESGCSTRRVIEAIPRLVKAGLMTVQKENGKSNRYFFPYKIFDKISPEFLDNDKISPQAKEYYIDLQQHLFIDEDHGLANTTYTNKEISQKLRLGIASVKRYNTELILNGMLIEKQVNSLDAGGCKKLAKIFDLKELCQFSLIKLQEHEEAIKDNTERINELEEAVNTRTLTTEEVEEFREFMKEIKKQKSLQNNKSAEFNF